MAGGANVTLTQAQWGCGSITLTGALTANIAVIFPATQARWIVTNSTTGAFSVTCKTAAGTGVNVTQGKSNEIFSGGTNILYVRSDYDSLALTGVPTAPTAAQFDSSSALATTAFVRSFGMQAASVISVTAGMTLTASAWGATVLNSLTPATTITLPTLASGLAGTRIEIVNFGASTLTLQCQGSDLIVRNGGGGVASIVLLSGDTITLEFNGGSVFMGVGGSAQLGSSGSFALSNGANGYQKLPSGLIFQWGRLNNTANATSSGTFPIAFPTAVLCVVLTGQQGAGNTQAYTVLNSYNLTSFTWNAFFATGGTAPSLGNTNSNVQGNFLAIGY